MKTKIKLSLSPEDASYAKLALNWSDLGIGGKALIEELIESASHKLVSVDSLELINEVAALIGNGKYIVDLLGKEGALNFKS